MGGGLLGSNGCPESFERVTSCGSRTEHIDKSRDRETNVFPQLEDVFNILLIHHQQGNHPVAWPPPGAADPM